MSDIKNNSLSESTIPGIAHHQLIHGNDGLVPYFQIFDSNSSFKELIYPYESLLTNFSIAKFLNILDSEINWDEILTDLAINGGSSEIVLFMTNHRRWYRLYVFSTQKYHITTIFIDISKEKSTINELQKLAFAVEQSSTSVIITDLNGNIEYVNPKFTQLTGYSFDEVKGKNTGILKSGEQTEKFYREFWETISNGKVWQGEFHNKKKNGELFWEWASISAILDENGIPVKYLAVKEDITKRKNAEKDLYLFSKVVEQSPNMIIITSKKGKILYANNSYYQITGFNSAEIIGKQFRFFQTEDPDDEQDFKILWDTVHEGKPWRGLLFDTKKDGHLFWLNLTINPITDEFGEIQYFVADMHDFTETKKVEDENYNLYLNMEKLINERTSELTMTNEILMNEIIARKKNETELNNARNEAEKANKAKSQFISRMSHELRTPLNSILGFAQLFMMGDLTQGQKKGVEHILNSGKHLLNLINEVLDISRIEAGRYAIHEEILQIGDIIADALELIEPLAYGKKIRLIRDKSKIDTKFVKVDKQALIQVLINLLNNAVKYNNENGFVKIKSELIKNNKSVQTIKVSIEDSGIGIEEKNIERIFNPFERFGPHEYSTESTGLGLSIAREQIKLMGGDIFVKSTEGKGSTFWIEIPCYQSENEKVKKFRKKPHLSLFTFKSKNKSAGNLLYIEDNISNIELVRDIIRENRPEITLITDMYGENTLNLTLEYNPFLILLDLNLPDIQGSDVLKILKDNEKTANIPVIILTADAMPDKIKSLREAGAFNYLTKPINVNELLDEIDFYKNNKK